MVSFIDAHRAAFGVEPICSQLPIAPSTYHAQKASQTNPELRSKRAQRDEWLEGEIIRVRAENFDATLEGAAGSHHPWLSVGEARRSDGTVDIVECRCCREIGEQRSDAGS